MTKREEIGVPIGKVRKIAVEKNSRDTNGGYPGHSPEGEMYRTQRFICIHLASSRPAVFPLFSQPFLLKYNTTSGSETSKLKLLASHTSKPAILKEKLTPIHNNMAGYSEQLSALHPTGLM